MASIVDSLQRGVEILQNELLSATQALVHEKSENPPGDTTRVADKAADLIKTLIPRATIKSHTTAPGIKNVVAVINGAGPGKRLLFSGHLDTYPAGEARRWSHGPFDASLSEDGQRLYGRGVSDMKGGIASSIIAASVLALHYEKWNGHIVLAFAGDEETMGTLGSEYLLENVSEAACDAMICGDAGSPLVVRAGEKGFVWIELSASGKASHGAHVHRGENAIDKLLQALNQLKELEAMRSQHEAVNTVIKKAKTVSEGLGGDGEADVLQRVTVNIGTIKGGTSTNLVADSANASLDIRIPYGISVKEVLHQINQRIGELVKVTVLRTSEPSWTPADSAIIQHTLNATHTVVDEKAVVNMRVGASDSRLFRRRGIPSVVLGLTPYNMGGPDEYIQVNELQQVAKVHTIAAFNYLTEQ